jgi:hypothetical protein
MLRKHLYLAAIGFGTLVSSVAHADEPEPNELPPPTAPSRPPARPMSGSTKTMIAGATFFAGGWLMYSLAAALCSDDCQGTAKLAVPFAGYALYLGDPDRQAQEKREEEARRKWTDTGAGCENTMLGCAEGIENALKWLPTILQVGGAVIFLVGLAESGSGVGAGANAASRAKPRWAPDIRTAQGGATFGITGTF